MTYFHRAKGAMAPLPPPGSTTVTNNYISDKITCTLMSQGVRVIPWKVLGPGDDNSESINNLKVYCP